MSVNMTTHESIVESVSRESGHKHGYAEGYAQAKREAWDVVDHIAKFYIKSAKDSTEDMIRLQTSLYIQQQIYTECNE